MKVVEKTCESVHEAAIRKAVSFDNMHPVFNKPKQIWSFAGPFGMGKQPPPPCKKPAKAGKKTSPPRKMSGPFMRDFEGTMPPIQPHVPYIVAYKLTF